LRLGADNDLAALEHTPAGTGTTTLSALFWMDGSGNLTITGATATKASGTTWANPSDPRLKEDVAPYTHGLAELTALAPITYRYNGLGGTLADGTPCIGLDAAAVEPIMPECVFLTHAKLHPDDAEAVALRTLNASPIIFALINAVQELAARLAALEAAAPA
jgi:hypothetical protein